MTNAETKKFSKDMLELTRHNLGVINIKDILDAYKLGKTDRKNYIAAAHELFLNPVFMNEVKNLIALQKDFTVLQAENDLQSTFGRGTINGLTLLYERVLALNLEYEGAIREKRDEGEFDPLVPLSENAS